MVYGMQITIVTGAFVNQLSYLGGLTLYGFEDPWIPHRLQESRMDLANRWFFSGHRRVVVAIQTSPKAGSYGKSPIEIMGNHRKMWGNSDIYSWLVVLTCFNHLET